MQHAKKSFIFLAFLAGLAGLLAGLSLDRWAPGRSATQPDIPGLLWPNPKALSAFSLTDHAGREFNLDSLKDKWTFFFFGYTHCPDICPVTLAVLAEVERRLSEAGLSRENVQVVFVSLDPKRDTPDRLKQYVEYFSADFLGVTGQEERLQGLTRQLGIVHTIAERQPNGDYLVDHTASVLLTDPSGRFVAVFGLPHKAEAIANRFLTIRDFLES